MSAPTARDDGESTATRAGRRLAEVEQLSGIGSWEWDIRTNELHWSEQLCRVYGIEPDPNPITYEEFLARVHPEDRSEVSATVQRAFDARGSFVTEHRTVHPDGSVHIVYGRGHVLVDADGNPVRMLGSGQDVTDDRAAAEARAADERRLAADQARDDALALIAHDLRSPLSVIVGYVQLMERQVELGRLDVERLGPYLGRIDVAARQMTSLMDDLIDDASAAPAETSVERVPTDLGRWLGDLVEYHDVTIATHDIRSQLPDGATVVDVHASRLERAIRNLIVNAVKYSDEGSTVHVSLEADAEEARITVRDAGIGIPADELPRIFDRFHRGANVGGKVSGLGLGLTSALRAVSAHGGRIEVASTEGQGTTFTVHLPRTS